MEFSNDRREFLTTAAKLGLTAGALLVFDQACSVVDSAPGSSPPTPTAPKPQRTATRSAYDGNRTLMSTSPPDRQTPTPRVIPRQTEKVIVSTGATPTPLPSNNYITDPRVRMGHLLRRAGFGASVQEVDKFLVMGEEKAVSYLLEYNQVDDTDLERRLSSLKFNPEDHKFKELQRMALIRMIYTKRPLQEKMVLFWHGLLTSGWKKVGNGPHMLNQDELFRRHALAPYDDLLKEVAKDPAMLIWLDSRVNKKNRPNENFARELMELFSMGVGTFTEDDVRDAARAFTGWSLRKKVFFFEKNQHDFGMKTFLGNTGNHGGTDIVDIIMEQPITSIFISKKLFEFFAYDNPEQKILSLLSSTFVNSGYSVKAVVEKILTSDEFYSNRAYRAKIKSPVELVVGIIRSLEIQTNANNLGPNYITPMGQELFNPFDVSGWPEGAEWINSSTLLNRLNFVNAVAKGNKNVFDYDLVSLLESHGIKTSEQAVDYFLSLFLDGEVPTKEKAVFVEYLDGLVNRDRSVNVLTKSRIQSLIYLVMCSPDHQLA